MVPNAVPATLHFVIMNLNNLQPRLYKTHITTLLALGLPIIVGQLGTIVQGLADTVMVGHFSAHSLAAAGFVNNVMNLILIFALGYSYSITPVVGPLQARNDFSAAGQALRAGLRVNGLMGTILLLIMGIGYFFLGHIGQPEELLPEIRPYYIIVIISIPFQTLFNAFKQFTDSIGHTRIPMWMLISANVFNIIGNWLLIYGVGPFPCLGLAGAGISTLLSRIGLVVAMCIMFIHHPVFRPYRQGFVARKDTKVYSREIHHLGWPLGLQMGMETASFSLSAVMQGWIGTPALAAHQIMCIVGSMCFMVYYGIGAAVAIRISHFHGLGDIVNVRRNAFAGYFLILTSGILIGGTIVALSPHITSFFTDDARVNAIVMSLILPFILYQIGDGLQINFANSLRAIADVKPLMKYAFISYIVISLPLSYIFGFICHGGPAGIWFAFPVALTTAGLLFMSRFLRKTKITPADK